MEIRFSFRPFRARFYGLRSELGYSPAVCCKFHFHINELYITADLWIDRVRELHLAFDIWGRTDYEAQRCLDRIADQYGGRFTSLPPDEVAWLRRELLKLKDGMGFDWIIRWPRATHTYSTSGTYHTAFFVDNASGSSSATKDVVVAAKRPVEY